MHCWKTVNVKRQYGFDRIFLLSSIIVFAVFTIFHVVIGISGVQSFSDQRLLLFIMLFLFIYPLHKLLHFLPLFKYRANIKINFNKLFTFTPGLFLFIKEPVPKSNFVFALLLPFFILNFIILMGAYLFPTYAHYFSILLSFHCGLCLIDIIYVKHLVRSPKKAVIEETVYGYEILVPPTN